MKTCTKCNIQKDTSEFGRRGSKFQPWCKSCWSLYQKARYKEDPERFRANLKGQRDRYYNVAHNIILEYIKDGCIICKESDIRCLDFDHIDPSTKSFSISNAKCNRVSEKKLREELEKCQVLCSNCHRKRTSEQFNWYARVDNASLAVMVQAPV